MSVITLRNIKLNKLRTQFKRSLMLKNGDTLNFSVSSSEISGIACNTSESLFKKWSVMTNSIAEFDDQFEAVKVSIYKGNAFESNVLGYFDKECSIDIHHVNCEATKLVIYNETLSIVVVTAPTKLSYVEYSQSQLDRVFNPGDALYSFTLSVDETKQISSLSKLSTNPETQSTFVLLSDHNGQLVASDNAFKLNLHEQSTPVVDVKINKSFLGYLCPENYDMTVHDSPDGHVLVAKSQQSNTIASMVLIEVIEPIADFDFDNTNFSWTN